MECDICKKEVKLHNSVVCSEHCGEIRKMIFGLEDKYFPTHGCDNCWGDLHQGCSDKCKEERKKVFLFGTDLWNLIHLIFPKK